MCQELQSKRNLSHLPHSGCKTLMPGST
uniref:Uncharacterized protein n=1 Tax=Arundo donax TaxID=35708 RepID=A0A0A9AQJ4_ARUDO